MEKVSRYSLMLVSASTAISVINYGFGVALSWFFTPSEFGALGVAQSLLMLLALAVGSGFAWTTAQDTAAQGLTPATRRRFRAAWLYNILLAGILGAGIWLFYGLGWLNLGPVYRLIIPLTALTTLLLAARSVSNGVLRGRLRFGVLTVNLLGEVLVKAGLGLLLAALGMGVNGVLLGFVLGALASWLHSLWAARGEHLWQGNGWLDGEVLRRTLPIFIGTLSVALMFNLDVLGLKLLSPAGASDELVGFYQAAALLARTPVYLAQAITLVAFSYASASSADPNNTWINGTAQIAGALRSWLRFLLPVGMVFMLAPHAALSLFFPAHYQSSGEMLRWVAAGGTLLALVTLLNGLFQGLGKNRLAAACVGGAGVAQMLVLAVAVPRWDGTGAALSLVVASLAALSGLLGALFLHRRSYQALTITIRGLANVLLPLAALAIPLLVLPDGTRLGALAKLAASAASYLVALAFVRLRGDTLRQPSRWLGQMAQIMLGE